MIRFVFCSILELTDMLPSIIQQLGGDSMFNFKSLANSLAKANLGGQDALKAAAAAAAASADDDDVPQLVENFDEASKNETV